MRDKYPDRRAAHQRQARGQVHPARGEPQRGHRRSMIRDGLRDILVAWVTLPRDLSRAILFDAGNTLVRMNYAAIADRLAALGHEVTPAAVQRAEWRARVRFDEGVLARPGTSTESSGSRAAYLTFLLQELEISHASTVRAMAEWREAYNAPVGIFDVADPEGPEAVALARNAGLGVGVISNSNGTVRELLDTLGLGRHLDFVIDSFEVRVEKPDPGSSGWPSSAREIAPDQAVYVGDLYSVDVCRRARRRDPGHPPRSRRVTGVSATAPARPAPSPRSACALAGC